MSCGQACDGCNERAQHHLCPACANEDIDNLKKELREAQAVARQIERTLDVVTEQRDVAEADNVALRRRLEDYDMALERDAARAEVKQLRETVKTAGDRLRACGYRMTEQVYQEMASALFDLPASAEEHP